MVINKRPDAAIAASISVKGFRPAAAAKVATLNGPDYLSHNDDGKTFVSVTPAPPVSVKIAETAADGVSEKWEYAFPAHSITVIDMAAR
jgi:alpha-L-arabinofuranosidase